MEFVLLDPGSRNGYYLDRLGEWQPERRVTADRRAQFEVSRALRAMRRRIRRTSDREMLSYIASVN